MFPGLARVPRTSSACLVWRKRASTQTRHHVANIPPKRDLDRAPEPYPPFGSTSPFVLRPVSCTCRLICPQSARGVYPVKILLVDDSKLDRARVSECLEESGFDFVTAENGTDAWEILQAPDAPTFALLDWVMPGFDGIELCRRIRTLGSNGTYIYTVMLTAKDRKKNLLTAMEAGADDYLAKPVDPSELRARILVGKRILDLQQCLRFSATHDFLTNLLSRAEILASLERELVRTQREGRPAGVIMADVDGFKQINDTLGHPAGDAVLAEVARRLKSDLRLYDVAGRYGGEEFILVLPGCDLHTAARRADEIRRLVSRDPVVTPAGALSVTVSMGVTVTGCDLDTTLETLLQSADAALYRAKKAGRNRVEAFSLTLKLDEKSR